jgi:hypothetical protein
MLPIRIQETMLIYLRIWAHLPFCRFRYHKKNKVQHPIVHKRFYRKLDNYLLINDSEPYIDTSFLREANLFMLSIRYLTFSWSFNSFLKRYINL